MQRAEAGFFPIAGIKAMQIGRNRLVFRDSLVGARDNLHIDCVNVEDGQARDYCTIVVQSGFSILLTPPIWEVCGKV